MDENGRLTLEDIDARLDEKLGAIVEAQLSKHLGKDEKDSDSREFQPDNFGKVIRGRTFTINDDQKGIAAARMIRCLAAGKGDMQRARYFAEKAFDDDLGDEIVKALTASELTEGGALVRPEYAAEIIELLRSRTVVRRAGARTVPMSMGSLTIRKQTAGSTASYIGESQDIPVSQPDTGQIDMVSKKLSALVPISNDLLRFTSGPSADEFVRDDLVEVMAIREDRAFMRDDGSQHTPKGMRNWAPASNVSASNGTSSDNIESDFRELINALEDNDVRMINPAWFMHPSRKNFLINLRDANGNLIYPQMRQAGPTMYDYPVFVTTSIPKNLGGGNESEVMFSDMNDALIGEVSGMEIMVDASASYIENGVTISAFQRDETLIRAITRHDFAMRHDVSVAVKNQVTWGA